MDKQANETQLRALSYYNFVMVFMPIFGERKILQLEGLSQREREECEAFFESRGISKDVPAYGPGGIDQYFQQYLEETIDQNRSNETWLYYVLAIWYFSHSMFEKTVALCVRAYSEHPNDPRAYYLLGTIYDGIYQYSKKATLIQIPDAVERQKEIQELLKQKYTEVQENPQIIKAFRESKIVASPEEAARSARQYLCMTLKCKISKEDKRKVQTRIRIIDNQTRLSLFLSKLGNGQT